jgi:hypothetical protein
MPPIGLSAEMPRPSRCLQQGVRRPIGEPARPMGPPVGTVPICRHAASNTHAVDLQHPQTTYVWMEHLARFSGLMKKWAIQTAESVREVILCVS